MAGTYVLWSFVEDELIPNLHFADGETELSYVCISGK